MFLISWTVKLTQCTVITGINYYIKTDFFIIRYLLRNILINFKHFKNHFVIFIDLDQKINYANKVVASVR